jgi:predicted AlkP superfamily pyrophosphatase or phosphodiesterase
MKRTIVLNVVGLTPAMLGEQTPNLSALAKRGSMAPLRTITPAVTCSVQATLTTGTLPRHHGIVGNGWYFRELAEVGFWKQSNHLVKGPHVWDLGRERDPSFTCAKLFFWFNMYARVDWSVTPRPMYPADGRKLPDVYSEPPELRAILQERFGQFPLFHFWGPMADIVSSAWIGDAAQYVYETHRPTLTLVYLPHLDYDLQRLGPNDPAIAKGLTAIDRVAGKLIDLAGADGARVIVLSEYGITEVGGADHPNRALRRAGLLRVRDEMGRELLDAGASDAFAVADHQIAHVYVKDRANLSRARSALETLEGVERVLDDEGKREHGLDHPRAGELVLISKPNRWFTYYYWDDDDRAPDFARTVDIHRKPGYDPVELFVDPEIPVPKLKIGGRLALRRLGFRALLDVISLDASLVKGSHGRVTDDPNEGPLFISSEKGAVDGPVDATSVRDRILRHVFEG